MEIYFEKTKWTIFDGSAVDLGISWIDRLTDFSYFLYHWKYQNMVFLSFEHLQKIRIFPKSGGRSSKIVPATPISILSF